MGNHAVFEKTERFSIIFSRFLDYFSLHELSMTQYFKFLNSVLTKNLEIGSSFFRIFISTFFKLLKISNLTDRFLVNWQNRSPPVFSVVVKMDQFSTKFESMVP
jgi:hypothetical protein